MSNFSSGASFGRIKGISDRRRMPRLGKIRLGMKIKNANGTEFPAELPFFLLPDNVAPVFGGKVSVERARALGCTRADVLAFIERNTHRLAEEIRVMFPLEDEIAVFPQAYLWYGGSAGVKCRGNGEAALRVQDDRTMAEIACPCERLKTDRPIKRTISMTYPETDKLYKGFMAGEVMEFQNPKGDCTQRGHLLVLVPEVSTGGIFQVDTGAYNSIVDLNSSIDYVRALVGRIAMVPLTLRRVPRETHGDGKKQVHFTLQLEAEVPIGQLEALRRDTSRILMHQRATPMLLEAPDDSNPAFDDGSEVVEVEGSEVEPQAHEVAPAEAPAPSEPIGLSDLALSFGNAIKEAATMDELQAAWGNVEQSLGRITPQERKDLVLLKDMRKSELKSAMRSAR